MLLPRSSVASAGVARAELPSGPAPADQSSPCTPGSAASSKKIGIRVDCNRSPLRIDNTCVRLASLSDQRSGHADASQPEPLQRRPRQVSASGWCWTAASPSCRGARKSTAPRVSLILLTKPASAPPRRTEPRRRPRARRGDPTGRRGSFLSPPTTTPTAHASL